jgi:hypothetical protein
MIHKPMDSEYLLILIFRECFRFTVEVHAEKVFFTLYTYLDIRAGIMGLCQ